MRPRTELGESSSSQSPWQQVLAAPSPSHRPGWEAVQNIPQLERGTIHGNTKEVLRTMLWWKVKVAQLCSTLFHATEFSMPEHWRVEPFPSPADLPNPGIEPRSPALQADSLAAEPQGKRKNTGVGSLSLLQGVSPNPGIEPGSPALQADSLPAELREIPKEGFGSALSDNIFFKPLIMYTRRSMTHHVWIKMPPELSNQNFETDTLPCLGLEHTAWRPFSGKDVPPCHCLAEIFYHGSKQGPRKDVHKKRWGLFSLTKVPPRWWKFAKHSARPFRLSDKCLRWQFFSP